MHDDGRKVSIFSRALRLPSPHILHHGWINLKKPMKTEHGRMPVKKNNPVFWKYVCWVANRSEAAHNGSGIAFFELPSKMCKVCTESAHCVALWTRTLSQVWACAKYVRKQCIAEHFGSWGGYSSAYLYLPRKRIQLCVHTQEYSIYHTIHTM